MRDSILGSQVLSSILGGRIPGQHTGKSDFERTGDEAYTGKFDFDTLLGSAVWEGSILGSQVLNWWVVKCRFRGPSYS